MNHADSVVISCPGCLRQYKAEASIKLARCGGCNICFSVAVAEPALPGEAIILDEPIEPSLS